MSLSSDGLAKSLNLLTPEKSSLEVQEIHKQFRNRLRTFIDGQKWVRKPLSISPTVCARLGWKCVNSQLLECETCSAKLSPGQLKIDSFQTYKASVQKVQEGLKTAHKKLCPWPLAPCPDSFVHMMPVHKEQASQEFKKRFESLITLNVKLPVINEDIPQKLGISEELCNSLLGLLQAEKSDANVSAVYLAATGWKWDNEAKQKKCLTCFHCYRTVALLLYTSVNSDTSYPETSNGKQSPVDIREEICPEDNHVTVHEEEQSLKSPNDALTEPGNKRKLSEDEEEEGKENQLESARKVKRLKVCKKPSIPFDPLFEHRPWCPWVIESVAREKKKSTGILSTQETDGYISLPGWQLFVKCLLKNIGCTEVNTSPLKEQISCARNLLESWSSPV